MAKPRKSNRQQHGDSARDTAEGAPLLEPLGEQLLREAREGQAEFVAGWEEFMRELDIQGEPVGARALRERLLRQGINPENNEVSRGILAMREEER